jgi:hypothetical protein
MKPQNKAKELKERFKSNFIDMTGRHVDEAKLSQAIECWKQQHSDLHEIFGWLAVCNKDEYVLQVAKSIKEKIANLEEAIKIGEGK